MLKIFKNQNIAQFLDLYCKYHPQIYCLVFFTVRYSLPRILLGTILLVPFSKVVKFYHNANCGAEQKKYTYTVGFKTLFRNGHVFLTFRRKHQVCYLPVSDLSVQHRTIFPEPSLSSLSDFFLLLDVAYSTVF